MYKYCNYKKSPPPRFNLFNYNLTIFDIYVVVRHKNEITKIQ